MIRLKKRTRSDYLETQARFDEDESPIRTSLPVNNIPVHPDPAPVHTRPTGHAGGSVHDPCNQNDLRNKLHVYG